MLPVLALVVFGIVILVRRAGRGGTHAVRPEHRDQSPDDALTSALGRWERAGIIDRDQARRIQDLETLRLQPGEPRLPMAAEAVGYLGGALMIVGGLVAFGQVWDDLPIGVRITAPATAALVLLGAGAIVRRRVEPAFERLASASWFLATGAATFTAGVAARDAMEIGPPGTVLGVGGVALVAAVLLWLFLPQPLQHVAVLAAAVTTAVGLVAIAGEPQTPMPYGIAVWAVGGVWMLLARNNQMPPALLGWLTGGLTMLAGSQAVAGHNGTAAPGLTLGIATVVAIFVIAVIRSDPALLGLGVVGVFWFVPQAVVYFVGDALGISLTLALIGVVLLAMAASLMPLRERLVAGWGSRHSPNQA